MRNSITNLELIEIIRQLDLTEDEARSVLRVNIDFNERFVTVVTHVPTRDGDCSQPPKRPLEERIYKTHIKFIYPKGEDE